MANIRQYANGRWQAVVRRHSIKAAAKTFDSKIEANRWARLIESEIDRGVFVDRSEAERITISELIDRYLVEITPKKKSARRERGRLNGLKRQFGTFSPVALRTSHIAQYRDARLAAGLAGATAPWNPSILDMASGTALS